MQYSQCTANDGCTLAYQTSLLPPATTATNPRHRQKTCIILMHGFSGSSAYFEKNFAALSATHHWVVAPDMRGHGRSGRSRGCYDEATTQAAQETWTRNPAAAHAGLVADCLGYRFAPEPERGDDLSEERRASDERFFAQISAQCDPVWLARLLADHTRYDHREAIEEGVTVPTLVLAGRRTGCFPLEGMRETVKRVERGQGKGLARFVVFDSGHWLFWEEPERFNGVVGEFVDSCTK